MTSQPKPLPASLDSTVVPTTTPVLLPARPPAPIQRAVLQQPPAQPYRADDTQTSLSLILEPPGGERLNQLHSETDLFKKWLIEARERNERISFPDEPVLTKDAYRGRAWPERALIVEPNYVNYGRLLFEEKNAERYGWDLGLLSPLVSTGYFFKDLALLPYHRFTDPCRRFDSNAGYCLPGDPVPYKLYPEGLSVTGAMAEAAAIVTLLAVFP